MKTEEVEHWIDVRTENNYLNIDKWTNKETNKEQVNIFYWVWTGKSKNRISIVGDNIEECVEKGEVQEALLLSSYEETKKKKEPKGNK